MSSCSSGKQMLAVSNGSCIESVFSLAESEILIETKLAGRSLQFRPVATASKVAQDDCTN
eukprot:scaffold653091_cov106-Prasinocladus_malaysianus.AAC.1